MSYSTPIIRTRLTIRRDLPKIAEIEAQSFRCPLSKDQFATMFMARNVIPLTATIENKVVGFCVYALYKKEIEIMDIAVDPLYRRLKVGTSLLLRLISKLSINRRFRLSAVCEEGDFTSHTFFSKSNFRLMSIYPNYKGLATAYHFQYNLVFSASLANQLSR